jgi:DNA-binding transcriptional LysR family regulator
MDEIDGRLVGGLVVLAAVADMRSFGRAAERLGMTQSGVSKAIAKLESRLAARLVHRTSRAVELTDEGRVLYERVIHHLAGIGEAAAETSKSREAVRGKLRVNVDPLFSRMVLSPNLSEFLQQNPAMELRIETRDRIADLVSDGFDLAIRFGEPAPSALIARRILNARILTVASPIYIDRHGRPKHPQDLASDAHQCIRAIDPATGRPFQWEFWRGDEFVSVAVNGRLTVTDSGTKLGACLAGFRRSAGHRPGAAASLPERRPHRPVPRLAGRALPALCLLSFSKPRAGEGKAVHRFHCRVTRHADRNRFNVRPARQRSCDRHTRSGGVRLARPEITRELAHCSQKGKFHEPGRGRLQTDV